MTPRRPRLLISNDDGITSPFLPPFVNALSKVADVLVVVPAREQSWIGRAYSRHNELVVVERDYHSNKCYTISGTPSDCVNIALAHLCQEPIDAVVSGLNIGQNVAFPLLWSSGTFAAAVEAAGWGKKAFAFSMRLEKQYYEQCRLHHKSVPAPLLENLEAASAHASNYVIQAIANVDFKNGDVHNINYPIKFTPQTPIKSTVPANAKLSSLYQKTPDNNYRFSYKIGETTSPTGEMTDLDCLDSGSASISIINFL